MREAARTICLLCLASLLTACGGEAPAPDGKQSAASHVQERPASEFISVRQRFVTATEPAMVPASQATWLKERHEVFGVVVKGRPRAYPIPMLAYHHAVNDVIEGVPILVTYCVVCSAGICFDPVVEGTRLTMGFEGSWSGTATLYDEQTESLWLQLSGECIAGPYRGRSLKRFPTGRHTTWSDWRRLHPDTEVMARDAGLLRPGHRYLSPEAARSGSPFVPSEMRGIMPAPDPRLASNELLYGVVVDGTAHAFPFRFLSRQPVVEESLGKTQATLWFDPGSRSAAAFDRRAGERLLSFISAGDGRFRDRETGSIWNMEGRCVSGELEGTTLTPLHGLMTEAYGWLAGYPATEIWGLRAGR